MAAINRLLIVDDQQEITRLIETFARTAGYDALSINDTDLFERALQQIEPTVVFLDIAMPRRDGMELIGRLAAGSYPGKVVLMSGADERYIQMSSTIAKTRGLLVAGTLAKPFRKQAVTDLLIGMALPH
jgi:DNA-binding response OmpR family regulator